MSPVPLPGPLAERHRVVAWLQWEVRRAVKAESISANLQRYSHIIYICIVGYLDCLYCTVLEGTEKTRIGAMPVKPINSITTKRPRGLHCQRENSIISTDLQKVMLIPHIPSKYISNSEYFCPPWLTSGILQMRHSATAFYSFVFSCVKESFFILRPVCFHFLWHHYSSSVTKRGRRSQMLLPPSVPSWRSTLMWPPFWCDETTAWGKNKKYSLFLSLVTLINSMRLLTITLKYFQTRYDILHSESS